MSIIRSKYVKLDDQISADSMLGKKVTGKSGLVVGKIEGIWMDPSNLEVQGITTSKGWFKGGDYIGRSYISSLTKEGAILNVDLTTELIGFPVVDSDGKNIGKVKTVERSRETNDIESIMVSRGGLIGSNEISINGDNIKEIGTSIMLDIPVKG